MSDSSYQQNSVW